MKHLYMMITKAFVPVFVLSLVFFVLILELVDLFGNLWRYLNYDVTIREILTVAFYYLPKCINFSIPIALLFAVSFTLGNYYSDNELIAVFGSGISLYVFIVPFLIFGILLSVFMLVFEENVVIDTFKKKNNLSRELLHQQDSYSNTNVTVLSRNNRIVYHANYYNENTKTLTGLIIVGRDDNWQFLFRIDANNAKWDDGMWRMPSCRLFTFSDFEKREGSEEKTVPSEEEGGEMNVLTEYEKENYSLEALDEPPKTFRKNVRNVEEMQLAEAKEWIDSLKKAGLPHKAALTDYYKRMAFAFTPFVVALISCAIGGRFKKNILLMSLLTSLVIAVIYYVMQMVLVLFAKLGIIQPFVGAWGAFIIFLFVSFFLFNKART